MRFGLQPPVKCSCGREYKIECDTEGFVVSLYCNKCGREIEVSRHMVELLPKEIKQ